MPGTHLLPPNLLKLFSPRPPLPYKRPVDRDIDRIHKKNVDGVGHILARLEEETFNAANTASTENMEEGEEPVFTHAEEVKRQIRREQRKARREEDYKNAKDNCSSRSLFSLTDTLTDYSLLQTSLQMTRRLLATHTKLYLFLDSSVPPLILFSFPRD